MDSSGAKNCVGKKRKPSSAEPESECPAKRTRKKKHSAGNAIKEDPSIFKLPEEILIKIIDLVPMAQWPSLEMVSRRFKEVMHGQWMRTREIRLDKLVYNEEEKKATNSSRILDSALRKFLRRAPNIVSISGFEEFCVLGRRLRLSTIAILAKFQHLDSIEFTHRHELLRRNILTAINMAVFLEKSASRQCLKSFNVTPGVCNLWQQEARWNRALGGDDDLPTMHLESFVISTSFRGSFNLRHRFDWRSLKKLIIDCEQLPVNGLISSLQQCDQIEHLELTVHHDHHPPQAQIFGILAGYEKLSILKINSSIPNNSSPTYQNAMVSLIRDLGRRGRITSFALSDCNDQIVREIAVQMPLLKSLELHVDKISAVSKKLLVTELKCLETLKLRSINSGRLSTAKSFALWWPV